MVLWPAHNEFPNLPRDYGRNEREIALWDEMFD